MSAGGQRLVELVLTVHDEHVCAQRHLAAGFPAAAAMAVRRAEAANRALAELLLPALVVILGEPITCPDCSGAGAGCQACGGTGQIIPDQVITAP